MIAQKGHINKDFAREVYGLVGIQSEYWGEVAERAEAQTIESANEAAFEASASMTGNNKESLQKNENETKYKRNGAFISREVQQDLSGEERSDAQQGDRDGGTDTGLGTEIQQGLPSYGNGVLIGDVRASGEFLPAGRSLRGLAQREHGLTPEAKEKAS